MEEDIKLKEGQEFRAFNFEVRAGTDEKHGNIIEGVPIVFNQNTDMGWYQETIASGALDKCDMKDVRFLVNHNTDMIPLARSRNNNEDSTMQMKIEENGLHIRVDLDVDNNTEAKNLYSAVSRKDVSGMSFMFSVVRSEWDETDPEYPTRKILEIGKIWEVSAVTWPAYEGTTITSRCSRALDSAKNELDSLREERKKSLLNKLEEEERSRKLQILSLE